jgi:hypothetical protein
MFPGEILHGLHGPRWDFNNIFSHFRFQIKTPKHPVSTVNSHDWKVHLSAQVNIATNIATNFSVRKDNCGTGITIDTEGSNLHLAPVEGRSSKTPRFIDKTADGLFTVLSWKNWGLTKIWHTVLTYRWLLSLRSLTILASTGAPLL